MTHHTTTSTKGQAIRLSHRLLAMVLATLGLVLLLGAGSASAIVVRPQIAMFGPDGTTGSSFVDNETLAFEPSTHRLFVVSDGATPGIYGFDVSGSFPPPVLSGFSPLPTSAPNPEPGLAVDNTALSSGGNIYYSPGIYGPDKNFVYGFDNTGAPLGGNFPIDVTLNPGTLDPSVGDLCNTAVDSAGNLWVASYGSAKLLKYSSAGVFQEAISTSAQGVFPCNLAFDSNDDLYVGSGSFPTWKYTAASSYTVATKFDPDSSSAIAVDPTTHHVFIGHAGVPADITEFDEDGNVVSRFATEILGVSPGIPSAIFGGLAFDSDHDRLYVADAGNYAGDSPDGGKIRVFGTGLTYPDLTLGTPSGIENTSATANGTISSQGVALTDCRFEYVNAFLARDFSDLSSGGSAPCSPAADSIPVDSATHPVSATLSDLSANTAYRFRLVAANANGSIVTLSDSFETTGPPLVETTGSPVRTATTARLDSRVSPSRAAATYHFEYGDQGPCDANPCTSTPPRKLGPDETQKITIKASTGQFKLSFGPDTTSELPFNASAAEVQAALQALPSIGAGNVTVSGGPGDLAGSKPYFAAFTGELAATDVEEIVVLSGAGKKALSSPHSATVQTTLEGGGGFNEAQSIAVAASGGQFKLFFGANTSADIAFNASASTVAASLEALPSIGAGNVIVTGGPGNATGSNPYVVRFVGPFANTDVAQLVAINGTTPLSGITEFGAQTTVPGGIGNVFLLVSQQIEGLEPGTTYHYRVVADNGNPDGPAIGEDMTLTTFAEEAPLSHGQLPGPVGSDRAWELVSAPDTSGNPVGKFFAPGAATISDAGDRAVYAVAGGTPDSEAGTVATRLFAQRTSSGWQTKNIYAPREEATGDQWFDPGGPSDLSAMVAENNPGTGAGEFSFWRLSPDDPPQELYGAPDNVTMKGGFLAVSEDASRVLVTLMGSHDPDHPVAPGIQHLYDISSGSPQLIGLLPDGTVPACGVVQSSNGGPGLPQGSNRLTRWVTADGSLAFFPSRGSSCGDTQRIYLRDFGTETTKSISSPTVSGKECEAFFIKSIPGAAYLYTKSRLAAEDAEPSSCGSSGSGSDGDVYRYDLGEGALDCVTCVVAGLDADVTFATNGDTIGGQIGIAEDGSRVYFTSGDRLLPGAPAEHGIYRLAVASGELAYVGDFRFIGEFIASVMDADGSVVAFSSDNSSLNALGGQQNGGGLQYYLYDDNDRSLICVSCPADGSVPRSPAAENGNMDDPGLGANTTPLSADGGTFAFTTPTALVSADQNTARAGQAPRVGTDIYEWREGKLLLVTDGLINWPPSSFTETPEVEGVTPSGNDIFFTAAAQYTKDALDGYKRLYDARIGGGFVIPPPPKPCPLEVCQGVPKGAPEEAAPGTGSYQGPGNVSRPARVVCAKPKRKVRRGGKTRCVKPARKSKNRQRANHDRRTQR